MTKSQVYFKTDPSRSMDFNKDLYEDEEGGGAGSSQEVPMPMPADQKD